MVELPNNDKPDWRDSRRLLKVRQWFRRDINDSRPLSRLLAIVPLTPAIVAEQFDAKQEVMVLLWTTGGLLALVWFGYVTIRNVKLRLRYWRRERSDFERRKRGEDLPIRCRACGEDLPDFVPPRDGIVYRFKGWECAHCGAFTKA